MNSRYFTYALIISLCAHLLLLALADFFGMRASSNDGNVIELFLDQPQSGWQVADISEPLKQEKPSKSKFLGMYNQRVEEETVASGQKAENRKERTENGERRREKREEKAVGSLFAMKSPNMKEGNEISKGTPSSPDIQALEDYYPDFKHGEHTYINVLRYPEIEYFVRLKRIFKTTWDPVTALRQESLSVSRGMVSCVVAVAVDKQGELSELFVLKSSGISGYDSEALRTVRASSPFSSPPEKFLKDGALRMSWTFVVYL